MILSWRELEIDEINMQGVCCSFCLFTRHCNLFFYLCHFLPVMTSSLSETLLISMFVCAFALFVLFAFSICLLSLSFSVSSLCIFRHLGFFWASPASLIVTRFLTTLTWVFWTLQNTENESRLKPLFSTLRSIYFPAFPLICEVFLWKAIKSGETVCMKDSHVPHH